MMLLLVSYISFFGPIIWLLFLCLSYHRVSPFDACKVILEGQSSQNSFYDRYNAYFVDYSMVPLLVQQNYLDVIKCVLQPLVAHP